MEGFKKDSAVNGLEKGIHLSDGSPLILSGVKQHSILEIFFSAVGRRPELGHVFGPIGLDPGQPKHRKRK